MSLSDQLSRLTARTKELEDRAAAAKAKARVDLENDVKAAGGLPRATGWMPPRGEAGDQAVRNREAPSLEPQ
jgi:hypothetical protein